MGLDLSDPLVLRKAQEAFIYIKFRTPDFHYVAKHAGGEEDLFQDYLCRLVRYQAGKSAYDPSRCGDRLFGYLIMVAQSQIHHSRQTHRSKQGQFDEDSSAANQESTPPESLDVADSSPGSDAEQRLIENERIAGLRLVHGNDGTVYEGWEVIDHLIGLKGTVSRARISQLAQAVETRA